MVTETRNNMKIKAVILPHYLKNREQQNKVALYQNFYLFF